MISLNKFLIFVMAIIISGCYPKSPYQDCHEKPLNSFESSFIDSLKTHTGNPVFITRIDLSKINNNKVCENKDKSYCIYFILNDTNLFLKKNELDHISTEIALKIYSKSMDDTSKAITNKIEISIGFEFKDSSKTYCAVFNKEQLERYYGYSYQLKKNKIFKKRINLSKKVAPTHYNCFY